MLYGGGPTRTGGLTVSCILRRDTNTAETAGSKHATPCADSLRDTRPPLLHRSTLQPVDYRHLLRTSPSLMTASAQVLCFVFSEFFSWLGGENIFGLLICLPNRLCAVVAFPSSCWTTGEGSASAPKIELRGQGRRSCKRGRADVSWSIWLQCCFAGAALLWRDPVGCRESPFARRAGMIVVHPPPFFCGVMCGWLHRTPSNSFPHT